MTSSAASLVGEGAAAEQEVRSRGPTLVSGYDADGAGGTVCGGESCADRAGTYPAAG